MLVSLAKLFSLRRLTLCARGAGLLPTSQERGPPARLGADAFRSSAISALYALPACLSQLGFLGRIFAVAGIALALPAHGADRGLGAARRARSPSGRFRGL